MAAAQAGGGGGGVLSQVCRLIGEPKRTDLAAYYTKFFDKGATAPLEDALLDEHLWQMRPRMNAATLKQAYKALPKEQREVKQRRRSDGGSATLVLHPVLKELLAEGADEKIDHRAAFPLVYLLPDLLQLRMDTYGKELSGLTLDDEAFTDPKSAGFGGYDVKFRAFRK